MVTRSSQAIGSWVQQQPLVGIDEAQEDLLGRVLRFFIVTEKLAGPSQDLTPISPVQTANASAGHGLHAQPHEHAPYRRPAPDIPGTYAPPHAPEVDPVLDCLNTKLEGLNTNLIV